MILAACGGSTKSAESVTIELKGTQPGRVTLTELDDDQTRVVVVLREARRGGFPAHIHEQSCAHPDPRPVNELSLVRKGRSETVVDVTLKHLRSVPHAIDVHRTADLLEKAIACGTVGEGAGLPGR